MFQTFLSKAKFRDLPFFSQFTDDKSRADIDSSEFEYLVKLKL